MSFGIEVEPHDWNIGKKVRFSIPENFYPTFSYRYILTDSSVYSFLNSKCTIQDYHRYFTALKEISGKKIDFWQNARHKENYHFKIDSSPTRNLELSNLIKKAANSSYLKDEQMPITGHFHLAKHEGSRKNDEKPIVLHFFVGPAGEFFILALDLLHEIHQTKF
jgi:hypothetical protein